MCVFGAGAESLEILDKQQIKKQTLTKTTDKYIETETTKRLMLTNTWEKKQRKNKTKTKNINKQINEQKTTTNGDGVNKQ